MILTNVKFFLPPPHKIISILLSKFFFIFCEIINAVKYVNVATASSNSKPLTKLKSNSFLSKECFCCTL